MSMPRTGLMHIPKSGGTSLVAEISRHFDADRIFRGYDNPTFDGVDRDAYDLFVGHVGFDLLTAQGCGVITLLRDPVERFLSHYYYWNSNGKSGRLSGPDVEMAATLSLDDFVKQVSDPRLFTQFHNVTAWTFACGIEPWRKDKFGEISDDELLERAIENLHKCAVVGQLEDLPRFEAKCSEFLGKPVGLPHTNENAARKPKSAVSEATLTAIRSIVNVDIRLIDWFITAEAASQ